MRCIRWSLSSSMRCICWSLSCSILTICWSLFPIVSLSISVRSSFSWFLILVEGKSIIEILKASNDKALFQLFKSMSVWWIISASKPAKGMLSPKVIFLRLPDCINEVIPRYKAKIANAKNKIEESSKILKPSNMLEKAVKPPNPITNISVSVYFSNFLSNLSLKLFDLSLYIYSPNLKFIENKHSLN